MRINHPSRRASAALIAVVGVSALVAVWLSVALGRSDASAEAKAAAPAAISLRGTVFYDKNDDGVRDLGEPGVAGIRIHDAGGDESTLTASDGSYAFSSLPTSGYLQVETGWFRSQCPPSGSPNATSCGSGPGADNDFVVANQFIRHMLTGATAASATNVNVGLVPDWSGSSMTIPAAVGGVIPANRVDVAARMSWASSTCVNSTYEICRAGDTFALAGQIFNQGTAALTGIKARVYVPPGDCVTGATLVGDTIPAGLGALTVTPSAPGCSTRYLGLSLAGVLAPGGGVRIRLSGRTATGPGTPGCVPKKIDTALCPTLEPQGRGWLLGVSHIDQTGDPDSTFCAAGDMTRCPTGLHDKRRAPDEIDPAGHNVDARLGGTTDYDLRAGVRMLTDDTVRAFVSNTASAGETNASPEKVQVKIWLPTGTTVLGVPPKHTLIKCDGGRTTGPAVVVTCTLGGPIAPTMSSPAIDLRLASPPSRVVLCVTRPATATMVPVASSCGLSTDAAATPTDNDATLVP